jgi:hypothetical protein
MWFAATSGAVVGFMSSLLLTLFAQAPLYLPAAGLAAGTLLGGFGSLMNTVSIHPLIYLMGGSRFLDSYRALAYASGSNALFLWIPGVNLLGLAFNFYLQAMALSAVHDEITLGKAAIAETVPAAGLTAVGLAVYAGLRTFQVI